MKILVQILLKKVNFILFTLCIVFMATSCNSYDDDTSEEEISPPEEALLDFSLLVDSWRASEFFTVSTNSSLPDANILANGGTVDLAVDSNSEFTFTVNFEIEDGFMNSGEFRIEDNVLQARFEDNVNYSDLEAEIGEESLSLEGLGVFDFSGEGSNIPLGFRGRFLRN